MQELPPHFFRHQSGQLVSRLVRLFGVHNLALAEDVAQEALVRALEVWKLRGLPDDPPAWLLTSARNRAIDLLRRERTARTYAPELGHLLDSEWTLVPAVDEVFAGSPLGDDELRMMCSICHPRLPEEVQVALVLHLVGGFGAREIAAAFFASPAAIEKRLSRGRRVLAGSRALFDLRDADLAQRLGSVHSAIYLLFNEGYHGASADAAVREDLCREALRLMALLAGHPLTATPATLALAALLCLHAARLPARLTPEGRLLSMFEQDRAAWDRALTRRGLELLGRASGGEVLTEYHVEAAIAALHAMATGRGDTDWAEIVRLYDLLLRMRPSPVVALSRAIALGERDGPARGLEAIAAIDGRERLARYPFYEAALGELHLRARAATRARDHFRAAVRLARSPMERSFFEERLRACDAP